MASVDRKYRVLFLSTGNASQSQMAEGWARALRFELIEAYSAGTGPHDLNRLAVIAMAEAGVDISGRIAKRVDTLAKMMFDFVVTVCDSAKESCPVLPGFTNVVHFGFDDSPKLAKDARSDEEAMPHFRRVRDEIRRSV